MVMVLVGVVVVVVVAVVVVMRREEASWTSGGTYVEDSLGLLARRVVVPLGQRDELLSQPLGLLRLVPGRVDGLVLDERGHEVAQQGLPVR